VCPIGVASAACNFSSRGFRTSHRLRNVRWTLLDLTTTLSTWTTFFTNLYITFHSLWLIMQFHLSLLRVGLYGVLVRFFSIVKGLRWRQNRPYFPSFSSALPRLDWTQQISWVSMVRIAWFDSCQAAETIPHCTEPIVAELLVSTLFTIPWSLYMWVIWVILTEDPFKLKRWWSLCYSIFAIYKRFEHPYFATFATEIAGLSFLWLFWIVGAGTASVSLLRYPNGLLISTF